MYGTWGPAGAAAPPGSFGGAFGSALAGSGPCGGSCSGGGAFSEQERSYYGQLFAQVDTDRQGRIGGLQAANFLLSQSGLDRQILKQIWDVADSAKKGWLGPEEFSAALRLVAHVQAGRPVAPDLVYIQPPALPRFTSTPVPPGTASMGRGERGRSPGPRVDRTLPTARDLRKYGRLFCNILAGRGNLMTSENARQLFSKSGLSSETLAQVWDVSDADHDGHLSWPEFVVAMHLIRRTRLGEPVPKAVPMDLRSLVVGLDSAQGFAAQASRSPRALSTASARSLFDARTDEVAEAAGHAAPTPPWSDVGPSAPTGPPVDRHPPSAVASFGDAFSEVPVETPGSAAFGYHGAAAEEMPALRSGHGDPESPMSPLQHLTMAASPMSPNGDDHSPDFGGRSRPMGSTGGFIGGPSLSEDAQPVEHLEALIEAEKRLVQTLRADTDELDEELHRLEDSCRTEEKETARERVECDRLGQERKHLEQQMEASKRLLAELKAEHEALHLESILLRRDRGHYGAEATFLQRLFDEGTRDAQALQQSIEYLEQSNQSLAAHTKSLEEARREILEQVKVEKELLRKEEFEAQSAKQALETLRGAGTDGMARFGFTRPSTPGDEGFGFGPSLLEDPPGSVGGGLLSSLAGGGGLSMLANISAMKELQGASSGAPGGGAAYRYRPTARPPVALREGV